MFILVLGVVTARAASSPRSGALVLLAALVPFLLMLVRDVRRALLVVVILDTAFLWDKNFDYQLTAANLGAFGGLNVSVTTIALAALYFMWFAEIAVRCASVPRGLARASLPLTLYVGITALSMFVARDQTLSEFEIALLVQSLLLFVYVVGTTRTAEDVRFAVVALISCLLAESLLTLALPYVGSHKIIGLSTYAGSGPGGDSRFGGTFGAPNSAATFFSILVAPAVAVMASTVSRRVKRLAAIAAAAGTLALVLTLSRGGWIAFVVSFVFLTVAALRRGWISPRIPIAAAIGLTVLVLPFGGMIATRVTGNDQNAAGSRLPLIHLAGSVIANHPVLGIGANNLGIVFPTYAGPQYSRDWIYTVHNKYLLVWAEAGIGALIAFVWFLLAALRRGWRTWSRGDPLLAPLALGLMSGLIGRIVHMGVDTFQGRAEIQSLVIVTGLLVAMSFITDETAAAVGRDGLGGGGP